MTVTPTTEAPRKAVAVNQTPWTVPFTPNPSKGTTTTTIGGTGEAPLPTPVIASFSFLAVRPGAQWCHTMVVVVVVLRLLTPLWLCLRLTIAAPLTSPLAMPRQVWGQLRPSPPSTPPRPTRNTPRPLTPLTTPVPSLPPPTCLSGRQVEAICPLPPPPLPAPLPLLPPLRPPAVPLLLREGVRCPVAPGLRVPRKVWHLFACCWCTLLLSVFFFSFFSVSFFSQCLFFLSVFFFSQCLFFLSVFFFSQCLFFFLSVFFFFLLFSQCPVLFYRVMRRGV